MSQDFCLTPAELEQAMVLNRFGHDMLYALLDLVLASRSLAGQILWLESLGHDIGLGGALAEVSRRGAEEGELLLTELHPLICEQWGYCRRRASDGLGDPRVFIGALAELIGPMLKRKGVVERGALVAVAVFVARADLSRRCQCGTVAHHN